MEISICIVTFKERAHLVKKLIDQVRSRVPSNVDILLAVNGNNEELETILELNKENIQVVIGLNHVPFGNSQKPVLSDFADGINTMQWLEKLT
jgi:glycosyltransferase involved in cell wall biosynthesis